MELHWTILILSLAYASGQKQVQEDPCKTKSRIVADATYCDRYWECQDGQPELYDCPNGLVYAGKNRGVTEGCDYPWRANYCEGKTQANGPIGREHCDWLYGIFGHETSCTRYWTCWNGTATEQLCIGGLLYNENTHSCDWPENVDGCQKHPLCNSEANGNVPLGKSCNRYWQCQGGYPRLQRCPAMLVFDKRTLRCVVPPTEDCEVPTTIPPPPEEAEEPNVPPQARPHRPNRPQQGGQTYQQEKNREHQQQYQKNQKMQYAQQNREHQQNNRDYNQDIRENQQNNRDVQQNNRDQQYQQPPFGRTSSEEDQPPLPFNIPPGAIPARPQRPNRPQPGQSYNQQQQQYTQQNTREHQQNTREHQQNNREQLQNDRDLQQNNREHQYEQPNYQQQYQPQQFRPQEFQRPQQRSSSEEDQPPVPFKIPPGAIPVRSRTRN